MSHPDSTPDSAPEAYVDGLFPRETEFDLGYGDVMDYGGPDDTQLELLGILGDPTFHIRIRHVPESEFAATKEALYQRMKADEPDQDWRALDFNFLAELRLGERHKGEPEALLTFKVVPEPNVRGRVEDVFFRFDLVWVRPRARGRCLGAVLVASLAWWLHDCRVYGARVLKRGVEVSLEADFYSAGGERCANQLADILESLRDERRNGVDPSHLGWDIRQVHFDMS